DRAGVVVVARVDRVEVEGAGRVELVRLRVRNGAVDDRVRGRGQIGRASCREGVGVEGVGDGAEGMRGVAAERGGVVGRGTDVDRARGRDSGRERRRVRADGSSVVCSADLDRAGVVVVARVDRVEVEGAGRVELVRLRVRNGAVDDRVRGRG